MNDVPHNHQHQREEHEKEHQRHGADLSAAPYWKRIHRDWRFWIALMLMLGAMAAYLITDDEVFRSTGVPQQPVPALGGQ